MEFEIYFKSKSQGESRSSVCLETDKTYQGGPPKRVEKGSKEGTGRPFPLAHHRSRSPDHRVAGHWTTTVTTIFFYTNPGIPNHQLGYATSSSRRSIYFERGSRGRFRAEFALPHMLFSVAVLIINTILEYVRPQ